MLTLFNFDLSGLWTWFGNQAIPFFKRLAKGTVDLLLRSCLPFFAPAIKVVSVVWVLLEGVFWAMQVVGDSMAQIALSGILRPESALLTYGAFINRFVPLVESFALIVLLAALWTSVIVVRWIKSFIPFFSN